MNNKKVLKTEEEILTELGFNSLEEYELSLKYDQDEHEKHSNEEAVKMGFKNADEMYKEFESYGKYTDDNGIEQYDEKLAEFDKKASEIKKIETKIIEKPKLYIKDDVKEGFDSKNFDDIFEKHYGVQEDRTYNIYYYLKHHLSYNRTATIKHHFKKEINAIENFMDIENINVNYETSDYVIPFLNAERNYSETFDCLKTFFPKLLKVLANYGIILTHDRYLFKSDFALNHDKKRMEPILEAYNKIKFVKRNNGLETLSKILTKSDDPNYIKATSLVLYHWIWSIKYKMRKYLNIESPLDKIKDYSTNNNPFVPVLYGIQGAGKSTLITALIKPLKDVGIAQDTTPRDLFEPYALDLPSKFFILTLDDLSAIKEENVPDFKRMITGEGRTGRQKGDQASKTFKSKAHFILGSNVPVDEVIQDETGNRRFFQINTPSIFYKELEGRNFLSLWQSVDENSRPISSEEQTRYISPYQFRNRRKSKQEEFVNEFELKASMYSDIIDHDKYIMIPVSTFIKIYSEWVGFKTSTFGTAFKNLIEILNVKTEQVRIKGLRQNVIYIEKTYTIDFQEILNRYNKKFK